MTTKTITRFVQQAQQGLCDRYAALPRTPFLSGRWLKLTPTRLVRVQDLAIIRYRQYLADEHTEGEDSNAEPHF